MLFVGVRPSTKRGDKSAGEFPPVGKDRRNDRLHLGGAESQEPVSRTAGKRSRSALTKLKIERRRLVRWRKEETAVWRQARDQAKVSQNFAIALRVASGAAHDT